MGLTKVKISRVYNNIYCLVVFKSGINSKLAAPHEKQNKKKIVCFEYRELPINISLAAHNNLLLLILNSTK